MKLFSKKILGCLIALQLSGCINNDDNADKNKIIEITNQSSSEDLTEAGEMLVDMRNFPLANKMFDLALRINADNKKAQFYSKLLAPLMTYRGVLVRVQPLLEATDAAYAADFKKAWQLQIPKSPIRDFLTESGVGITNAEDVVSLFAEQRAAWNSLRTWLRENRDTKLTLQINPNLFSEKIDEKRDHVCDLDESKDSFSLDCDFSKVEQVEMSAPDFLALQHIAAGYMVGYTFYTSYSLANIDMVKEISESALSHGEKMARIRNVPGFMTLRADNGLADILSLRSDLTYGIQWVKDHQQELCPKGNDRNARPENLFQNGICDDAPVSDKMIADIEKFFTGPIAVEKEVGANNQLYKTEIDYVRIFSNPIQDIKRHIPLRYNGCDKPIQFVDLTLEGILPHGDLDVLYDQSCQ